MFPATSLVYGASDRHGVFPSRDAARPDDLAGTIFPRLGIDPHREVLDARKRPLPIAAGHPLTGLRA